MDKFLGAMSKIVPVGTKGNWRVDHFTMTPEEVKHAQIMSSMHPGGYREVYDLEPGNYCRLVYRNMDTVMSDTPMELRTQARPARFATGDCLVGGLGLGIFVLQLQAKPEVKSIIVVEKDQDVIDLVSPHLPLNEKVVIIRGDIFDKTLFNRKTRRFDFIYFDIWNAVCGDNADEMGKLKRWYRPLLQKENQASWIGAWREDDCIYQRRQSNRGGWY